MKLSLPANISKLRKEHSMTQEQPANLIGVSAQSISKFYEITESEIIVNTSPSITEH